MEFFRLDLLLRRSIFPLFKLNHACREATKNKSEFMDEDHLNQIVEQMSNFVQVLTLIENIAIAKYSLLPLPRCYSMTTMQYL